MHLIVRNAFGGYAAGERITAATTVAEILAGENAGHVVKVPADPGHVPLPNEPIVMAPVEHADAPEAPHEGV